MLCSCRRLPSREKKAPPPAPAEVLIRQGSSSSLSGGTESDSDDRERSVRTNQSFAELGDTAHELERPEGKIRFPKEIENDWIQWLRTEFVFGVSDGTACELALDELYELSILEDGHWRSVVSKDGCSVMRRAHLMPKAPTVWRSQAMIPNTTAEKLMSILADPESHKEWNSTLVDYQILDARNDEPDAIGRPTLITRTVASEAVGGLVSPRDFCNLLRVRHYQESTHSTWIIGGLGLLSSLLGHHEPPFVRGLNGPCGFVVSEDLRGSNKTSDGSSPGNVRLTYIINSDLRGWLSSRVIDLAISSVMLQFHQALLSSESLLSSLSPTVLQ